MQRPPFAVIASLSVIVGILIVSAACGGNASPAASTTPTTPTPPGTTPTTPTTPPTPTPTPTPAPPSPPSTPPPSAPQYTITDLGVLPGFNTSAGLGINRNGEVTGAISPIAGTGNHAFLYSNGMMKDLGANSTGYAINDSAEVVGFVVVNNQFHAMLYNNGTMNDLGTAGGSQSFAYGINDAGVIAGSSELSNTPGTQRAMIFQNGKWQDLGDMPGHSGSYGSEARAINQAGAVAGDITDSCSASVCPTRGFLWIAGSMTDLGTLGGNTRGTALNNSNQVVGGSDINANLNGPTTTHAFLWTAGTMTDLGVLPGNTDCGAIGINDAGTVVGECFNTRATTSNFHAFLYSGGKLQDLNALIPQNSGWTLEDAHAINNVGQITGSGTINGQLHAYILTPAH